MNKIAYILIAFIFFACNSENGSDCFKKEGGIVQREVDLLKLLFIQEFSFL
jgi:hypothetical protein